MIETEYSSKSTFIATDIFAHYSDLPPLRENAKIEYGKFVSMNLEVKTVYEIVGGDAPFQRMVRRFYADVENDPVLRPMYPEDLTESILHLELFLIQYFGGPRTYHELRGHPRMRMRHMPFAIGLAERDAWMRHMRAAVQAEQLPQEIEDVLLQYFERTATFMMNR